MSATLGNSCHRPAPRPPARRRLLRLGGGLALGALAAAAGGRSPARALATPGAGVPKGRRPPAGALDLFLCGDVMTGRGIDQLFARHCPPRLYEPWARSALDYVALARAAHGPIPRPVDFEYVWGDALEVLARMAPDLRIVNLETAVTTSEERADKGIHYRMHPANVGVLRVAGIDCAVLANNHVLDWGREGLMETLRVLRRAGIATAGAGAGPEAAGAPAVLGAPDGTRVLVFALAHGSSGVPRDWAAAPGRPGVARLADLSARSVAGVAALVARHRRSRDRVLVSLHWGGNWDHHIPAEQRDFAHGLIDSAGVDLVHGHSSHHVKAFEVYRGRLILYGCGDLLNDYEGIRGHESWRPDLGLMYFPRLEPASGRLLGLRMIPTRIRRMRIERAPGEASAWLQDLLNREGRALGTVVRREDDGTLVLEV